MAAIIPAKTMHGNPIRKRDITALVPNATIIEGFDVIIIIGEDDMIPVVNVLMVEGAIIQGSYYPHPYSNRTFTRKAG